MKHIAIILSAMFFFTTISMQAQNVGIGTMSPDSSAVLDITSAPNHKYLTLSACSFLPELRWRTALFSEAKRGNPRLVQTKNNVAYNIRYL